MMALRRGKLGLGSFLAGRHRLQEKTWRLAEQVSALGAAVAPAFPQRFPEEGASAVFGGLVG
jgi:hypothetical protein